MVHPEGVAPSA